MIFKQILYKVKIIFILFYLYIHYSCIIFLILIIYLILNQLLFLLLIRLRSLHNKFMFQLVLQYIELINLVYIKMLRFLLIIFQYHPLNFNTKLHVNLSLNFQQSYLLLLFVNYFLLLLLFLLKYVISITNLIYGIYKLLIYLLQSF